NREKSIAEKAKSRGFTPSTKDFGALIELLGGDDEEAWENAERALLKLGSEIFGAVIARSKEASSSSSRLRARVVRLVGKLDQSAAGTAFLIESLSDTDAKARRNAIIALGKVRGDAAEAVEDALLGAWGKEE